MLVFSKRTARQITEEQVLGLFSNLRKGNDVNTGKNAKGAYWVSLTNNEGSVMISVSNRVRKALDKSLEGVEGKAERLAIAHSAYDECSVLEVDDFYEPAEGQEEGQEERKQKFNADGSPAKRWILSIRGQRGSTEQQVNANVAKAATFSIKSAMTNRV